MARLDDPLRGVLGGKTAAVLADALDLHTVDDLLRHYPRRYAQRGELSDLASLREGEHVTVLAEVAHVQARPMRHRKGKRLEVTVTDGRGTLMLTFFNKIQGHERVLRPGREGLFAGKVSVFRRTRQLTHPAYQLFDSPSDAGMEAEMFASALIPVYPATAKLPSWKIARCVRIVLDSVHISDDPLPEELRHRHGLVGLEQAYERMHAPATHAEVRQARQRLKWDEAFGLQVALAQRRHAARTLPARPRPGRMDGLEAAFDECLPFTLTGGQRQVGERIAGDLAGEHPMHRLLQGDVGSGKTVVALRAMLRVIDAGGQAALLAPTEVLAQQHAHSIRELLGPLGRAGELDGAEQATRVALVTGSLNATARKTALLEAASGAAGIVIGTHALLEEQVRFADLGLVVVDEQHRFGVEQRDALRDKPNEHRPHLLVMTATPIPRTVAMTVYGDLETCALTEMPTDRSTVTTHVVPAAEKPAYLTRAWQRLREEVAAGGQAYVVCPRVGADGTEEAGDADGSDAGADQDGLAPDTEEGSDAGRRPPLAVLEVTSMLANGPLSGLRVEALHGRMAADRKESVMRAFAAGEVDVIVATTVIEVGVDVTGATAMVVMDAERFGVSQLHQLRGRVGRGNAPALCLLVTDAPAGTPARERLDAVAQTRDGFELSRVDLEQRREGDVLGAAQSGRRSSLKLLALLRDEKLIREARDEAVALVDADPDLTQHPPLALHVAGMFGEDTADYLEKT